MSKTILVKNALVLATMDGSSREIKGGDVYIEGPEIKKVGKGLRIKADTVLDAGNCVVLPGLVNTHHHLYQTLTRNLPAVQDAKLFDWLVYLYEIWRALTPEAVYASAQVGLGELLLTGCTTSSDHLYLFPKKNSGLFIDTEIEAARELGIRFHAARGSMSRGRSKGGLPPDDVVQSEEYIMKDCQRLVHKYHDARDFAMTRIVLAPCSPFSVTTELLKLTAEMALRKAAEELSIPIFVNSRVLEIRGGPEDKVTAVKVHDDKSGKEYDMPVSGVFITVGQRPNVELAKQLGVKLDDRGFTVVDREGRTNIPGVYAAGDMTGHLAQIVTATADGAQAAVSAYNDLLAGK